MRKNEATPSKRLIGPIPFFDNSGALLPGQTFHTASNEVLVSLNGASLTAAANDAVEIGSGEYYYPATQAETNQDTFLLVVLRKSTYRDIGFRQDFDDFSDLASASSLSTVASNVSTVISNQAAVDPKITTLHQIAVGRWKIEGTQLFLYDSDGTTILQAFNLKDIDGNPSNLKIFERVPT